ncbi:hypothetical protein [Christiangramia sabulilitoris]|uniref:Uncharacterized protein n=1 Tax=Christiangramia sabulilitoris TaxID=2583991 RepID=A0A550I7M1_9FLAO|nr:hypothetical protein [Christiangramia sabulilitoris]TRO66970.1 hypothetical protein FGM01_03510 [Christiangramia sabulilitoris]
MTQYSFNIRFNDSEMVMLRVALRNMIQHCQEQLDQGEGAPYWAHKKSAERVLDKLYDDMQQISGNSFGPFLDFGEEE